MSLGDPVTEDKAGTTYALTTGRYVMDADVKKRWVTALRSGDYTQGTGLLCSEGKFCCLGVLNDIQDNEFIVRDFSADVQIRSYANPGSGGHLSGINSDWLEAQGVTRKQSRELSNMNDAGTSFDVIADWIEGNI